LYAKDELDIRSRDNVVNNGEVFTPKKIVNEMLELLPTEVWSDKSYCFLEPTCGNGNFLVEILIKRVDNGLTVIQALNTLIGMDITSINIKDSRVRLYRKSLELNPNVDKNKIKFILFNNIFAVKDSLKIMNDYANNKGVLHNKKFVFEDPTGNNKVMSEEERKQKWNIISKDNL
jgi:type I restriction-modification system DNA methylase subunit